MVGSNELRRLVRTRAGERCEYCGLRQEADPFFRFHIEHVIARQHGGATSADNLALSCHHCNLHKGPNLSGIDRETGATVALFNPRVQRWEEHFVLRGRIVVGLTETGRATVEVLGMNAPARQDLRSPPGTNVVS